ncbi:hypothetical protein [Nostoc sp. 'Peltigera membranacea cyanobiont' 210A]|uniref:hypothetical protein n=1 Tax=Nostoc sp. 'Peltigera membranacea cyanobiont' 210A TaxID=2014529 RepID=UPI00117F3124|nr:hypothetical protein [Nostoc sp. 'Peltigera membranacea cyanobiont' 210A]
MANIKITDLQTPTLIEELDDESLVAVVGGLNTTALNPTTELGKPLLGVLESLLKKAETALEAEIYKLAEG